MAINTRVQTIEVNDVTDVIVTEITQEAEGEEGLYVREIRVYGTPPQENQQAPLEFTLRLKSVEKGAIQITTPASEM